jgi:3-deoxy-D-manno-octulosonic-acid transferase
MGGSLIPHGGHNPLEPARLGSAVLFGPHMFNFAEVSADLLQAGGAIAVQDIEELSAALVRLFEDQKRLCAIADAGQAYAAGPADIVERLSAAVLGYLPAPTA